MRAYESIRRGLAGAIDFAQGKETGAVVHHVSSPAKSVSPGAPCSIGNTARRRPTGPAQVLLAMITKQPSLIGGLLR